MVGHWFVRRIDVAMAIYSVVMSIGFMIAFPVSGRAVQRWGWRGAWLGIGVGLLVVLAPLAWRSCGEPGVDGPETRRRVPRTASQASARMRARRLLLDDGAAHAGVLGLCDWSGALWAGRVGNRTLQRIDPGGTRLRASVYYQTLVVTAMTALVGNFLGGWLARHITLLLSVSLGILAGGVAALPHVSALWQVMAWATAMGLGGGLVMVLFFSVWARVFGRRDLGRIQGAGRPSRCSRRRWDRCCSPGAWSGPGVMRRCSVCSRRSWGSPRSARCSRRCPVRRIFPGGCPNPPPRRDRGVVLDDLDLSRPLRRDPARLSFVAFSRLTAACLRALPLAACRKAARSSLPRGARKGRARRNTLRGSRNRSSPASAGMGSRCECHWPRAAA